ncbi:hypothetical protein DFH09DRAFT_1084135 [Mycena vulgaris]|nr:hypothetical protein DFH09DRAFT_1084135 [Mycena vulgaris]
MTGTSDGGATIMGVAVADIVDQGKESVFCSKTRGPKSAEASRRSGGEGERRRFGKAAGKGGECALGKSGSGGGSHDNQAVAEEAMTMRLLVSLKADGELKGGEVTVATMKLLVKEAGVGGAALRAVAGAGATGEEGKPETLWVSVSMALTWSSWPNGNLIVLLVGVLTGPSPFAVVWLVRPVVKARKLLWSRGQWNLSLVFLQGVLHLVHLLGRGTVKVLAVGGIGKWPSGDDGGSYPRDMIQGDGHQRAMPGVAFGINAAVWTSASVRLELSLQRGIIVRLLGVSQRGIRGMMAVDDKK